MARWPLLSLLLAASALAGPSPPGLYLEDWREATERSVDPLPPETSLLNYFFTRLSYTNQLGDPAGLRGVSLGPIGEAAGSGVEVGKDTETYYVEQRWIPVLTYAPHFADGLAAFRAQFEVDFAWGLAANTVQPNQGGGFNGDQVNLQTKNVNVAIYPTRNPRELSLIVGLQPMYDSLYDPTITSLFDIVRTGYKLAFLGSEGAGVSAYANTPYGKGKASFSLLGAGQPDKASDDDARFAYISLLTLDYALEFTPGAVVGLSYWRLDDGGEGVPFAYEGLVKSGPGSEGLSAYTGTAPFPVEKPSGSVNWVGLNFHYDIGFDRGPISATGFAMYNFGRFTSGNPDTQLQPAVDIAGFSANLELAWNWGEALADVVTFEGIFTTGDDDPGDGEYTSAFTLNYYGLPGAVWFNHRTLLLFPFTQTVSNYSGAVSDISNQGHGLTAGILTGQWAIVRNTLELKLGTALGRSVAQPQTEAGEVPRGRLIGVEVNAELRYHIRYLMTVGLHGGYMFRGDFYDGVARVTEDPYALFTTFTWYAF